MNIWTLFVNQVKAGNPDRELVNVTLKLDVKTAVMEGQSTDTTGVTKPAKAVQANRALVAVFINAHKKTVPNIHTVGLEFDLVKKTVEITAIGNNNGEPVKGSNIEPI